MNPGSYIARNARHHRDAPALMFRGAATTFGDLERRTNRLVNALTALKTGKGDRVAIQAANRPEIVEMEIACYKGGFVKVPVNARYSTDETIRILRDSGTRVMIGDGPHLGPLLQRRGEIRCVRHFIDLDGGDCPMEGLLSRQGDRCDIREVGGGELAVLAYSSGTSGALKAIMQTFDNRMAMIRKAFMIPQVRIQRGDVFAHVGPITHASGMLVMPVLVAAGCNLILERFNVQELLEAIHRWRANYIFMVPAMINMILSQPDLDRYDLGSLKGIFYGAAPMSVARIREAMERFGPILVQGYGLTESTSFSTILTAEDHRRALEEDDTQRLSSCGRPIFESELKILAADGSEAAPGEPGEIVIRGPDVMRGYYRRRRLTREVLRGGWLHTGDIARMDGEGYVYIVDRKNDMIITGGFNVYPSEVERVLCGHPAVFEACVLGVPDGLWGEAVKAVVVLRKDCRAPASELIDYCGERLAGFKKPRSVEFVDSLPRNPNGKIARRLLRERFWDAEARRVH